MTTPRGAPRDVLLVKESLYPTVSPDGKNVAYVADGSLVVINVETNSRLTYPLPGAQQGYVGWSPDSKRLAYSGAGALDDVVHGSGLAGGLRRQHELASSRDEVGLWLLDLASGATKQIMAGPFTMPAWSPDGKWLSFDLRAPGRYEVFALETAKLDTPQPLPQETKKDHEREVAEWVLSRGGRIRLKGDEGYIMEVAKLPDGPIAITYVLMFNLPNLDPDNPGLQDLASLEELYLDHTSISDKGFARLKGLPSLRHLDTTFTQLTSSSLSRPEVLQQLEQFDQLRELWLTTDDDGVAIILQRLPKLSKLVIHGDLMTSAGLQHIEGYKQLKALHMGGKRIDDDGLANLHSASLEELSLRGTSITGKGLRHLKNLPSLARLNLSNSPIDDASVDVLKGIPNLTELGLGGTKMTANGIETLRAALPKCKISWP